MVSQKRWLMNDSFGVGYTGNSAPPKKGGNEDLNTVLTYLLIYVFVVLILLTGLLIMGWV